MRIFKVFVNRDLHQTFKRFVWRLENDFVLRLGGVQLKLDRDKKLMINPVYYPLFGIKTGPRLYEITLYLRSISYTFYINGGEIGYYKMSGEDIEEHNE